MKYNNLLKYLLIYDAGYVRSESNYHHAMKYGAKDFKELLKLARAEYLEFLKEEKTK